MLAEALTEPLADHGEGCVWLDDVGRVLWLDMNAGRFFTTTPDGSSTDHTDLPAASVGCVRRRRAGGFVAALTNRVVALDEAGLVVATIAWQPASDDARCNDGGCDPSGRFFIGTMAADERPGGGELVRLDERGAAVVLPEVSISNGIDWSADGRFAYYADSLTRRVDVFDYDLTRGELSQRRPFVTFEDRDGLPDGLCVDADGNVWVAMWGGSAVLAFDPRGRPLQRVEVPVDHVTACCFGGAALDQLFVTTSHGELGDAAAPAAGSLFVCRPGGRGQPPRSAMELPDV